MKKLILLLLIVPISIYSQKFQHIEKRGFKKIDQTTCENEDQTKQFLIMPFMDLLGYSHMDLIPKENQFLLVTIKHHLKMSMILLN